MRALKHRQVRRRKPPDEVDADVSVRSSDVSIEAARLLQRIQELLDEEGGGPDE